MERVQRTAVCGVGLLWMSCGGLCGAQTVTAVPKLDLDGFSKSWVEVARIPDKREKPCFSQGLALIAPGFKKTQFDLVQSCRTREGYTHIQNARGFQDKSGDGRLKIRYFWPFSQKYWVLAMGANGEWALVGSPNHKSLWIYSSTGAPAPEVMTEIRGKASAEGFDVTKLKTVPE